MPAILENWEVQPHGALICVSDRILTVTGMIKMPIGDFERRMTIVKLRDGRLVIYSAIALNEPEMAEIEAFGTPAFLIVPGGHHRLDAGIWKKRYPALKVIAPSGARRATEEAVTVDATQADFQDPAVTFVTVPGTGNSEAALLVSEPSGTTLVLNDVLANVHGLTGFKGALAKLSGFAGETPQVPVPEKLMVIDDKKALAAQFRAWADNPSLKRIIVSHGDVVENDPRAVLRAAAIPLE